MTSSRRRLLQIAGMLAGGAALGVVWLRRRFDPRTPLEYPFPDANASGAALPPTPPCGEPDATASQVEGPFYTPDTPLRADLRERASAGTPLVITGRVVYTDCRPVAGAVLDFWSCDGNGVYDNDGYHLRGHQFTDPDGAFRVETVKPGAYSQFGFRRTPHVHVKVQGRDTALLTTQLYFPGEPLNSQDSQFDESLVMTVEGSADRSLRASFRFVLAAEART